MNINCIICSDLFLPISEIYTTTCGHMFHYACLVQWLERSKTCPQCRHKCNEKSIIRIYLNLSNTGGTENDAGTLLMRLDNMELQTRLKERDIKECLSKYKKSKEQNTGLREVIKELELKQKVNDSAISALKDQVIYFKTKTKEHDQLNRELVRLRQALKDVGDVDTILRGSRDQVKDVLRQNHNPESLSILVSSLKDELIDLEKKNRQLSSSLYKKTHEFGTAKREIVEQATTIQELRNENESYRKFIAERPAPKLNRPQLDNSVLEISFDATNSPTVEEKVKAIQDSDSPYLKLKSSSLGLNRLLHAKFSVTTNKPDNPSTITSNKFSMFKDPQKFETIMKPDYVYDGLGGHCKEDKYPTSRKQPIPLKRSHKSSSSIPSSKFRKLSGPVPNSTLLEFIEKKN